MKSVDYGHYTTLSGLIGIVKNEALWATNIRFLNDEHEFQHALDLIKEIISKSKIPADQPHRDVYTDFVSQITERLKSLDSYESDSVFTPSFSEETDLLSQWRGYCPANNGYCVVFDAEKLHKTIKSTFDNCHLVECVYDNTQKESQLKKLLNDYWAKYVETDGKKKKECSC